MEKQGSKISPQDKIATALQNIKILNGILQKIHKINTLVDIYKKNVSKSKVKAISSMFESLTTSQSYYNDLTKLQATHIKYRRRNLSLPTFVERRLNFEHNRDTTNSKRKQNDPSHKRNKSEGDNEALSRFVWQFVFITKLRFCMNRYRLYKKLFLAC